MNHNLTLLLIFFSCSSHSQNREITKMDFTKMGFDHQNVFIYAMQQTDSVYNVIRKDTLGLFVYNKTDNSHEWEKVWAKLMSWQFLTKTAVHTYDFIESRYDNSQTGICIDDSFLMIHPTRFSYLTDLQHCPYPYFYNTDSIGQQWDWDFVIGSYWATRLYTIKMRDTFHFRYVFADTVTINTGFGNLFCHKIEAVCHSVFGHSSASYFLNADYGMLRYEVINIDHSKYHFELIEKGNSEKLINQQSPQILYEKKRRLEKFGAKGNWY